MSANSVFFDAQLRHATGVARYSSGEAKRVVAMLDKADAELTQLLKDRLNPGDFTSKRYRTMLSDIRSLRADAWKAMSGTHQAELFDLGKLEASWAQKAMAAAIPIEFNFASVDAGTLRQIVTSQPFAAGTNSAKTLQQWWSGLKAVDSQRIQESIQLGMTLGETVDQMVSRVRAVQDLTRANAAAVVRTAVNHVSNASRESFFSANDDLIEALRWTSTLDGRTTPICQARDGKLAPLAGGKVPEPRLDPPTARPPAHVSCRSLMIAILDANAIADQLPDRPFVRSTKTGKAREKDFRAEAKLKAGEKWSKMSDVQRKNAVKAEKRAWTKENIGQVPGATTYDEWLRGQSKAFQDDVLGPGRGDLFRAGEKLDRFVTVDGRELTLKQLHSQGVDEEKVAGVVTDRQRLANSTREPWTEAGQQAWEESLTAEERSAISDWTHTWDQDIRSVQRTGELAGEYPGRWVSEVEDRIKLIQTAFDRGIAREGEVYRGMALRQADIDSLIDSKIWSNACFSSSSRQLSISKAFAFEQSYGLNVDAGFEETLGNHFLPVVLRIKNRTGIDIDKLSWWTKHRNISEAETVLRPGATYRVLNGVEVDMPGEGRVWVIDMEEIWP